MKLLEHSFDQKRVYGHIKTNKNNIIFETKINYFQSITNSVFIFRGLVFNTYLIH